MCNSLVENHFPECASFDTLQNRSAVSAKMWCGKNVPVLACVTQECIAQAQPALNAILVGDVLPEQVHQNLQSGLERYYCISEMCSYVSVLL